MFISCFPALAVFVSVYACMVVHVEEPAPFFRGWCDMYKWLVVVVVARLQSATAGVMIARVEDEPLPRVYVCDAVRLLFVSMSDRGEAS